MALKYATIKKPSSTIGIITRHAVNKTLASSDMLLPFSAIPLTYTFIVVISIVSIISFYHKTVFYNFLFHPYEFFKGKRLLTIITSAFVHSGWRHLIINMYILYTMSKDLEYIVLKDDYGTINSRLILFSFFFISLILSNLIVGWSKRKDVSYSMIGASGPAFAFMALSVLYFPLDHIKKIHKFLPLYYSYDFALALFIVFTLLMVIFKKSKSNHKFHLLGLFIGTAVACILRPVLIIEIVKHASARFHNLFV